MALLNMPRPAAAERYSTFVVAKQYFACHLHDIQFIVRFQHKTSLSFRTSAYRKANRSALTRRGVFSQRNQLPRSILRQHPLNIHHLQSNEYWTLLKPPATCRTSVDHIAVIPGNDWRLASESESLTRHHSSATSAKPTSQVTLPVGISVLRILPATKVLVIDSLLHSTYPPRCVSLLGRHTSTLTTDERLWRAIAYAIAPLETDPVPTSSIETKSLSASRNAGQVPQAGHRPQTSSPPAEVVASKPGNASGEDPSAVESRLAATQKPAPHHQWIVLPPLPLLCSLCTKNSDLPLPKVLHSCQELCHPLAILARSRLPHPLARLTHSCQWRLGEQRCTTGRRPWICPERRTTNDQFRHGIHRSPAQQLRSTSLNHFVVDRRTEQKWQSTRSRRVPNTARLTTKANHELPLIRSETMPRINVRSDWNKMNASLE